MISILSSLKKLEVYLTCLFQKKKEFIKFHFYILVEVILTPTGEYRYGINNLQ